MEVNCQFEALAALPPGKEPSVPTEYDARSAREIICTLWRREKSLHHTGNSTPAIQPVAPCYTELAVRVIKPADN